MVHSTKFTVTDEEEPKQHSESFEADVNENGNDTVRKSVADLSTAFNSDETLRHFTGPASRADRQNISKTSGEPRSGKAASVIHRTELSENTTAPVTNGALEVDNTETHIYTRPATNSEATPSLYEPPDVSSVTPTDKSASGDHVPIVQQQPVSPGNHNADLSSDTDFIAVVRRKRKDTGAKPKVQQSEDLYSFWHRRPARPSYTSPKSNMHHPAGWSSPSQTQPASHKSANPSGVGLWDSNQSAFPALPSLRVRRNSTGDVPAASESNDDGSDLDSVKSVQTSTSRRTTAWGSSLGTSSYASVVIGNMSTKETVSATVSQSSSSILPKSPPSVDVIPSHLHCSDRSTFEEVDVRVSPVEAAGVFGSMPAAFDRSDFMVDSSIILHDVPSVEEKIGNSDGPIQSVSATCSRAGRRSHARLFFDTRSKSSSIPVPSLDISFGFDDSMTPEAVSSASGESQAAASTPVDPPAEPSPSVEFLQRSSVACPSTSSRTSVATSASLPRSSFDLRAAQKYLLSGECFNRQLMPPPGGIAVCRVCWLFCLLVYSLVRIWPQAAAEGGSAVGSGGLPFRRAAILKVQLVLWLGLAAPFGIADQNLVGSWHCRR